MDQPRDQQENVNNVEKLIWCYKYDFEGLIHSKNNHSMDLYISVLCSIINDLASTSLVLLGVDLASAIDCHGYYINIVCKDMVRIISQGIRAAWSYFKLGRVGIEIVRYS